MRTTGIIALGLVAAVVAQDWDEDFGPQSNELGLGNTTPGNGTGNKTINTTTTTTATTKTITTITTTTTLPKADFLNVAFFKDVGPQSNELGLGNTKPGNGTGNNTNTTTATTKTATTPAPVVDDSSCAINTPGQRAYFAKLPRTGCNCTQMPPPPQGWPSWGASKVYPGTPYYQLTLAAATPFGNPVASFHAFCDETCATCEVHRSSDATLPMKDTCVVQTPLPAETLDYNKCEVADFSHASFFLRLPVDIDEQASELCVLTPQDASVEDGMSFIEYPANTLCDANQTSPAARAGAMMAYATQPFNNNCTLNADGTFYKIQAAFDPATNMTGYSGLVNCVPPPGTAASQACLRDHCDAIEPTGLGHCVSIDNTGGKRASLSLKFIGSGSVPQCYVPANPTPNPTPKPSTAKASKVPLIAGAAGGAAVLLLVIIVVVRKRRASRAAAYSVLQGSSYTES